MIPTFAGFNMGLSAPAAPIMDHYTATGQFVITNYDSSLVYTTALVGGSGTATLNTSNGVYTLSSTTARFSISAGYSASSPQSAVDFMERTPYTATQGYPDVSYIHAPPAHGINIPNVIGARWLYCTQFAPPLEQECGHQEGTMVKASTPAGYTDSYGEWWRVS